MKMLFVILSFLFSSQYSFSGGSGGGGGVRPGREMLILKPKITLLSYSNNSVSFATATPSKEGWKVDTYRDVNSNNLDQITIEKLNQSNETKNWVDLN